MPKRREIPWVLLAAAGVGFALAVVFAIDTPGARAVFIALGVVVIAAAFVFVKPVR
jgi:hypothetical protein